MVEALNNFYDMVGNKPEVNGTITRMANLMISEGVTPVSLEIALRRCVKECGGFPARMPQIMERIPGLEVPKIEAEMRAAWDVLMKFVSKRLRWNEDRTYAYVDEEASRVCRRCEKTVCGNECETCGARGRDLKYSELTDRILDTVRRTGGWSVYLVMDPQDFPHQQKRFFEEYEAWTAVERILPDLDKILQLQPAAKLRLLKPMDPAKVMAAAQAPTFNMKRVPNPLSDAQLRDRREMLMQQAELLKTKAAPRSGPDA
jgi:hypothetical protein